jgi:NAD(P)-dependent dehydrogenase (short-subunit alcohol dehydrogenase family)
MRVLDLFSLKDRVAIVTGGARGLGRQHAIALAEAGAAVVVCDLLAEEGERTCAELALLGSEALFARVDVTNSGEIESFLGEVMRRYGRLDVLVNNASMPSEGCPLEDVGDELWRKIIDTNLSSMFYVGKRVASLMKEAKRGNIINIGSINSSVISNISPRHNVTYCVAKAGVAHLTRGMAAEWAHDGIRVNALAPGYIMTDQTAASAKIPEVYERNLRNTPMGRYGRLDELKGAIVFLASDASSFMTGSVLIIDGGYTVW